MSRANLANLPVEILGQIVSGDICRDWYFIPSRQDILSMRMVCRAFNHIVSHYAFYKINFRLYKVRPASDLRAASDGITAWVLTEKAALSPESNLDLIRAMHFEAANSLAASSLPVNRQNEGYRRFLWAAAGAAVLHLGQYKVMRQLLGGQSLGGVGNNSLPVAAFSGDEEVVRALLKNGVDVDNCHTYFGCALHVAVFKGDTTITRLLLDAGADISKVTDTNETALHIAAIEGHESVVQVLLEKGASTSADYLSYGVEVTPLDEAVRCQHQGIVRILLEAGAKTNPKCYAEFTVLHRAAIQGDEAITRILLEAGAKVSVKDEQNMTPRDYAASCGCESVVNLLLSAEADAKKEESTD
ncbi:MAG: hypothetical protein M1839_006330 [Geoglossum umbratile]|nr:MAG: hypothetical protein M1839_006330 [Geoglossum umbratile]